MPTSFLSADAGFPRLTSDVPMEERMNRVRDYLFLLLEQLRYTLSNLSAENFNDAALAEIEEAMTGPLRNTVTDLAGNVSTLEQTAAGLTSTVSNLSGDVSTLQQTATSLTSRITDAEGNISEVTQTANKINWIVASGTSASNMTMTPEAIDLIADGINITGYVTFNALKTAGSSVINGDNIELKADADGDSVSYLTYTSANGNTFAELHTRDNQTGTTSDRDRYAFVIETPAVVDGDYCAMKIEAGDNMSIEAGWLMYLSAFAQIVLNSTSAATRIAANVTYNAMPTEYKTQSNAYYFCSDGIYYGGTKILST
jgi:hypothetical protein